MVQDLTVITCAMLQFVEYEKAYRWFLYIAIFKHWGMNSETWKLEGIVADITHYNRQ